MNEIAHACPSSLSFTFHSKLSQLDVSARALNLSREEAYNLSQEVAKADHAEFISSFSKIAEDRGITPEEAYNQILEETFRETDEFLFQIEKERITELKVLKQSQQTPT